MTDLAIRNGQEVVGPEPTLRELAATAHREHELVGTSLTEALLHAIAAGESLLAARERATDNGQWREWLAANGERINDDLGGTT